MSTLTLAERVIAWAHNAHHWDAGFVESDVAKMPVAFKVGPHIGYGQTTNEAINHCADGLVEDGWVDDREYCARCEGDGELNELSPCTTFGSDCACNGPRVTSPCPDCEGIGLAFDEKEAS